MDSSASLWKHRGYHSRTAFHDTQHTLSLLEPALRTGDVILDVGCGSAYVTWELTQRHRGQVLAVDIVDSRRMQTPHFEFFDGVKLPVADRSCDVVLLSFVLHHVPDETKPRLIEEVLRVTRQRVIVLEDTPRNAVDRYLNRRHGQAFRKQIDSEHPFGFFSQPQWEAWFPAHGLRVAHCARIPRFARAWSQPYARCCFVLEPLGGTAQNELPNQASDRVSDVRGNERTGTGG